VLLGTLYERTGRADEARRQYELVEVIESRLAVNDDRKRLALLWADRGERLDEALAITTREADLRKDIFTADALAWTLYKAGRLTEAREASRRAMNPDSGDARILYHAGMIEKDLGNQEEARRLLERALKMNPNFDLIQNEVATRALSELRQVKR
jgi:tetratricopeptide (TPR) repeat protein